MRRFFSLILIIIYFKVVISSNAAAFSRSYIAPWHLSHNGDKLIVVVKKEGTEDDLVVVDLSKKVESFRLSQIRPFTQKPDSINKERTMRTAAFCGESNEQIIYTMEKEKEPWIVDMEAISLSVPPRIKPLLLEKLMDPLIGISRRKVYYCAPSSFSSQKLNLIALDIYSGASKTVVENLSGSDRLHHLYADSQDGFLIYKRDGAIFKLDLQKGNSQKLFDKKEVVEKYIEARFKLFGKQSNKKELLEDLKNLFFAQDIVMTPDRGNLFFSVFILRGEPTLKQVYHYNLLQNKLSYLGSIPAVSIYAVSPKGDYIIFTNREPTSPDCPLYSSKGRFPALQPHDLVVYDVKKNQIRKIDNFNSERAPLSIIWWYPYQDKALILKKNDLSLWILDITTCKLDKLLTISS